MTTQRVFLFDRRADAVAPGDVLTDAHRSPDLVCECEANGGHGCPFAYGPPDGRTTTVQTVFTELRRTPEEASTVLVLDDTHQLFHRQFDQLTVQRAYPGATGCGTPRASGTRRCLPDERDATTEGDHMTVQLERLARALTGIADVFGSEYTADDAGGAFNCMEADAIAEVLVAAGHDDAAATWLVGHADRDDGGDWHGQVLVMQPDGERLDWDASRARAAQYLLGLEHMAALDAGEVPTPTCTDGHRPDDLPEPGHRCKDCRRPITWVGPAHTDWALSA